MIDITGQKSTEERIASSLEEKELLLKEIHHRVKNNLQVISSLLKLQASYVIDKEALGVLTESQNRVQSMALIHQKLYHSKDLANIDLGEYINQLALNIFHSYKINTDEIKFELNSNEIKLGIDYAIPCGLIVNELITNALKHAFPNGNKGTIDITLNRESSNLYMISIADNGEGFPKNIDFKNTSSLGLQLVNTLASQIDGTVEMKSDKGTRFTVWFSINQTGIL
jgi:two-component sensor histidine kinase